MSSHPRRAQKVDKSQEPIARALEQLGVSVERGHDDLLIGWAGKTYWVEIKNPDAVSRKTGQIRPSELTDSEKERLMHWKGSYHICWSLEQVLKVIGL